jgi:hypothetical protein
MNDSLDSTDGFKPSALDMARLGELQVDRSMVSENGYWTLCRYPIKPNRPDFHEFTLLAHGGERFHLFGQWETNSTAGVLATLEDREAAQAKKTT